MQIALLLASVLLLSYFNGANDNFKGVATLLGSGTATYRRTLLWAALTTFIGSLFAASLAASLVERFSGKGLVPDGLVSSPEFLGAVAIGAAATILVATLLGLPVSTTHALSGGLLGSALNLSWGGTDWSVLLTGFLGPLLVSPFLALAATMFLYPLLRYLRIRAGIDKETCICLGSRLLQVIPVPAATDSVFASRTLDVTVGSEEACIERYRGGLLGASFQAAVNTLHYLSAGAVGFARGLNDTPKIVALMAAVQFGGIFGSSLVVAIAMAAGGLLQAHKVADTLSYRITSMNHGQGLTANLVTSGLVVLASRWGFPVSTTHVSCGALFGIGLSTGQANYRTIISILLAWVITLPAALLFSFFASKLIFRL